MSFVEQPVAGIAMLLWSCDPEQPQRLATPFATAAAAAAMEVPVELYFSARSVLLLKAGVAAGLRPSAGHARSLLDWMREAVGQGARFYVCSDALEAQGLTERDLIAECAGRGGAVQFMLRASDARWRAMVF